MPCFEQIHSFHELDRSTPRSISVSCDLNMEGLGSQADISNQFDTGVRSNQAGRSR